MSEAAVSFVSALLRHDVHQRLGSGPNGKEGIKSHAFMAGKPMEIPRYFARRIITLEQPSPDDFDVVVCARGSLLAFRRWSDSVLKLNALTITIPSKYLAAAVHHTYRRAGLPQMDIPQCLDSDKSNFRLDREDTRCGIQMFH